MSDAPSLRPGSFDTLAQMLRAGSGLVIGPDKLYLLQARLAPILRAHGLADLDALADRVRGSGGGPLRRAPLGAGSFNELQRQVIEAMTTNESFFFRDGKPFAHFRCQSLPGLHAVRTPGSRLRIWSAAASSGQEAYSLAMIVAESRALLGTRPVEILGTDISNEQLVRAREALYTQFEVQRGLPMQSLVTHFRKEGANWRINSHIRAMAEFREWNLLGDLRPLGQFDIVFCRNVLIYFNTATKSRVLEAISRQLAPDGLLYLGGAETVIGVSDRFTTHAGARGVYALAGRTPILAAAG